MNELEEIKSKINIVEYVGSYVQLKQAGRNFKGVCPFHTEKTPSFMVSPERQIWHCFGACNEGGDIFSFAQKIEGLTFAEAVESLARKAGVKISRKGFEKSEAKTPLYSANELAEDFYESTLREPSAKIALDYLLKKRKIKESIIKEFGLGFSPKGKSDLQNELKKHNFDTAILKKSGLVVEKGGETRDFFWGRLMFPIRDMGGKTIGFSARVLDDSLPKYINTPETEIYHKSSVLYGIDLAKESIRKADNAIVVEGMMDVIASRQAGVKNVVAPGGTALTENQLKLISRLTKNVKFAFDVDFAGDQATKRAIETAWQLGFNIKIIKVPLGKDPADAVYEDPEIWKKAVKNSVYVVDYLFDNALEKNNRKDAIGRKKIAAELLPVIKRIPDDIEKNSYIKRLGKELEVDETSILAALGKVKEQSAPQTQEGESKKKDFSPTDKTSELEQNILGLLIIFPHYLDFASTLIEEGDFTDEKTGKMFDCVIKYYLTKGKFQETDFLNSLKKEEREDFSHLTLAAESSYEDLDDEKKAEEIYYGVKRIKKSSIERRKVLLTEEISLLERKKDMEGAKVALKELQSLIEEESMLG